MAQPEKGFIPYGDLDTLFPNRRLLKGFEGGGVYEAETDQEFVLITSEAALADYLDENDQHLVAGATAYIFTSLADRDAYASQRRWKSLVPRDGRRRAGRPPERRPTNEQIYHLALRAAWETAVKHGTPYRRSTVDESLDEAGFIHCSFRGQVEGVADRFYRGRTDVLLLTIDASMLEAEVRIEGEGLFPHIYGPLPIEAVIEVAPVACGDDGRLLLREHLS